MSRLPITKTPKVYVGGAFIRSESARTFPIKDADGNFYANIPQCTRKDLRNAVEAAAKAGPGWAKRTPYNRGQIIYRLGEMLEARKADMAAARTLAPIRITVVCLTARSWLDASYFFAEKLRSIRVTFPCRSLIETATFPAAVLIGSVSASSHTPGEVALNFAARFCPAATPATGKSAVTSNDFMSSPVP